VIKPPAYKAGPGRGKGGMPVSPPLSDIPTLADLGLTKKDSSEAQFLSIRSSQSHVTGFCDLDPTLTRAYKGYLRLL